jgi:hypothetical protein
LVVLRQWLPGHIAIVCEYAETQASTIAERAADGITSCPSCQKLEGVPSGSQPPLICKKYGPGRTSPSTALATVRKVRATKLRIIQTLFAGRYGYAFGNVVLLACQPQGVWLTG